MTVLWPQSTCDIAPGFETPEKNRRFLSFLIVSALPQTTNTCHDLLSLDSPIILVASPRNPNPQCTPYAMDPLPPIPILSHLLSTASLHLHISITICDIRAVPALCILDRVAPSSSLALCQSSFMPLFPECL